MSAIRSFLDELQAEELSSVSDERLEEDLSELRRALDVLEGQFCRRVAEVSRRKSFARDGVLSTTSFLTQSCRMGASTAREKVRVADALERMPLTREALLAGELSYSQARVLVAAQETHPVAYREAEPVLLEAAGRLTVRELHRLVEYWRQSQDWEQAADHAETLYDQRGLWLSETFERMGRLDGWLDPESAEVVRTALSAAMTPAMRTDPAARAAGEGDRTSPARRRADALTEICRRYLERGEAQVGGERPHLNLLVDLESLRGKVGRVCELEQTGPIPAETARRYCCDASLSRIIVSGDSEPLDVGRRTRIIPAGIRRALLVRDRHCRFPGCERPPSWCDGHHLLSWIEGGETKLRNLCLLCRRHHRLVHEGGFRVERVEGRLVFYRPDGSVIDQPPGGSKGSPVSCTQRSP
jgi:hypothetical protein